jgi:hypothetical protein
MKNKRTNRRPLVEMKKASGLGKLFDSLYEDILKDSGGDKKQALDNFIDQVMAYTAGGSPDMGSSRLAVIHGDEVIKVALNEAGFAQNGIEATAGNDSEVSDIVVPVLSASDFTDHDGYLWIVSQKVKPLTIPGFSKEWQMVRSALKQAASDAASGKTPKAPPPPAAPTSAATKKAPNAQVDPDATKVAVPQGAAMKQAANVTSQLQSTGLDKMLTDEFLGSFAKLVTRYSEINTGDLYKPDSWGVDGDNIKLLDAGLTKSISKSYYKSTGSGLIFAGSEQAKQAKAEKESSRTSSIESRRSQNEEFAKDALQLSSYPEETALLLYVRGLVEPLPRSIFSYDPDKGLSKFDIRSASKTLRDQYDKVVGLIEKISDSSLKDSLLNGLDGILTLQESVGRSQLRSLIRMHLKTLI